MRFKDEKERSEYYNQKKKLNPADLNFMPNPQYLLDNRIDQYLDLDISESHRNTLEANVEENQEKVRNEG